MKKNYNIKDSLPEPSDADISKHKDFDKLLQQFVAAPTPTKTLGLGWKAIAAAASVAGLAGMLIFGYFHDKGSNDYESVSRAYFASLPYVNPPFNQSAEDVANTFSNATINAETGGVYEHPNGSRLTVPPNAFVDAQGRPVRGEVTLKYREFHDFIDIFKAGIPMAYDSAGVHYTLESAGMLELHATQQAQYLALAQGKSIAVELVSNIGYPASAGGPPSYNIYRLDEDRRSWVYEHPDNMDLVGEPFWEQPSTGETSEADHNAKMEAIAEKERQALRNIEEAQPLPAAPAAPRRAQPDDVVFDFDMDLADFPELDNFKGIMWKVLDKAQFSPSIAATTWEDAKLGRLANGEFEMTLRAGGTSKTLRVAPVLSGSNYQKALEKFNQEMAHYDALRTQRTQRLEDSKRALSQQLAAERATAEMDHQSRLEKLREMGASHLVANEILRQNVINKFSISSLGTWNCDRPLPPFVNTVQAVFVDAAGMRYDFNTIYLADKRLNTVYQVMAGPATKLRYDQQSDNLLWLVTNEGKLAVYRPSDFRKVPAGAKTHTFVLHLVDKKIDSEVDLREALRFDS
jgi:hypothetical protein